MYRFEKDYSQIKKYDKKSFNIIVCAIVIFIALIIILPSFIKNETIVFIAPLLWFPLIFCVISLAAMKLVNRSSDLHSKEGQQEFIEFYPDHLVICEKVSALESYYNYCKIYYDEIECTYLYKSRKTDKFLYMNISIITDCSKSNIQNHYYGKNYSFRMNLGLYPKELINHLVNNYKDIMKITIRYHRRNRNF